MKNCIRIKSRFEVKIHKLSRLKIEQWTPHNRALECLVYRPVVADTYHFDEERDLDSDPHLGDADPQPLLRS